MKKDIVVEIDDHSGFCFGVVNAIKKAEEELEKGNELYCLGDIVHNSHEVERLGRKGLSSIEHSDFKLMHKTRVMLRAHGEPPETYRWAKENQIEIIDATCPVVLQLQRKIKRVYDTRETNDIQIVIYGKIGHAEVNGLVGQTNGEAIVIESVDDLVKVDLTKGIRLFAQTTKSIDGLLKVVAEIEKTISPDASFQYFDTICRQVSNRVPNIRKFAARHDVILFVSGKKSSNGKVLYNECLKFNPNSYLIEGSEEVLLDWISGFDSIGICGATSTPKWLMEEVQQKVKELIE
ncbi:MAG: 4-hydroxy-3-methylbut-2-enyl diphosphate reductase [Bacteroidales bacterium]|nr:4-hydroxy-3-methylbut-2-enyl diphosphate reductase [Bacteroidales bacterium]